MTKFVTFGEEVYPQTRGGARMIYVVMIRVDDIINLCLDNTDRDSNR
jgi:hypothetical protein